LLRCKKRSLPTACLPPACRLPAACLPPACRQRQGNGRAMAGQWQGKGRAKAGSQWRYMFNLAFRYIYG